MYLNFTRQYYLMDLKFQNNSESNSEIYFIFNIFKNRKVFPLMVSQMNVACAILTQCYNI